MAVVYSSPSADWWKVAVGEYGIALSALLHMFLTYTPQQPQPSSSLIDAVVLQHHCTNTKLFYNKKGNEL